MPNFLTRSGRQRFVTASPATALKPLVAGSRVLIPTTDLTDLTVRVSGPPGRGIISLGTFNSLVLVSAASISALTNDVQLSWVTQAKFVQYVVFRQKGDSSRRSYPIAAGTGNTYRDGELQDNEWARYTVVGYDSAGTPTQVLDGTTTQRIRSWLPPYTLSANGTVPPGNYRNDDPNGAAITIAAGVTANITNVRFMSKNHGIVSGQGATLNIQNVFGWGLHPGVGNRSKGKWLQAYIPASVIAQYVYMEGFAYGFYVNGNRTTNVQKILLQYWRSWNIDCRLTTASGYQQQQGDPGHAFQADSCWQVPEYDVLDGHIVQELGQGYVTDVLNNYISSGLTTRVANIARNLVDGLYPFDPTTDPTNNPLCYNPGCAIIADGASDGTALQNGSFRASYNLVIGTSNSALAVANGNGLEFDHNQVLIGGYLPTGAVNRATNSGIYVTPDYAGTGSSLSNANVHDNTTMSWNLPTSRNKNPGDGFKYNNAHDFAKIGQNGNVQSNNTIDNRQPTDFSLELAAALNWTRTAGAAGRSYGAAAF